MKMNVKMAQNIFIVFGIIVSIALVFAIYDRSVNPVQSEEKVSVAQAQSDVTVEEPVEKKLYVDDIVIGESNLILTDDHLARAEAQEAKDIENKATEDVFVKPEKPTEKPVTTPPDYKPDTVPPADLLEEYDGQYVSAKDVVDVPVVEPVVETKVEEKPVVATTPTDTTKPTEKPVTTTPTTTGSSNLVPDSENPFKNTAPTIVDESDSSQYGDGTWGQGDKF